MTISLEALISIIGVLVAVPPSAIILIRLMKQYWGWPTTGRGWSHLAKLVQYLSNQLEKNLSALSVAFLCHQASTIDLIYNDGH